MLLSAIVLYQLPISALKMCPVCAHVVTSTSAGIFEVFPSLTHKLYSSLYLSLQEFLSPVLVSSLTPLQLCHASSVCMLLSDALCRSKRGNMVS